MATPIQKKYAGYIHRILGRYAAWPADPKPSVGDYGLLTGRYFEKTGTIQDTFGVGIETSTQHLSDDIYAQSRKCVRAALDADGEVLTPLEEQDAVVARMQVSFGAHFGVFLRACKLRIESVEDMSALSALGEHGDWRFDYHVITDVIHSASTTVCVSTEKDSNIAIGCSVSPVEGARFFQLGGKLSLHSQRGEIVHFIGQRNRSPLFRVGKVHRYLLHPKDFRPLLGDELDGHPPGEHLFTRVD
jgi:hypothetical protein